MSWLYNFWPQKREPVNKTAQIFFNLRAFFNLEMTWGKEVKTYYNEMIFTWGPNLLRKKFLCHQFIEIWSVDKTLDIAISRIKHKIILGWIANLCLTEDECCKCTFHSNWNSFKACKWHRFLHGGRKILLKCWGQAHFLVKSFKYFFKYFALFP